MKLHLGNINEIDSIAREFLEAIADRRIIAFNGSMGAGKTTFIKSICRILDSVDVVTSPTFTLVNEYLTTKDSRIYHFDFYRIEDPVEAMDFGFEEYLDSGSFCFIEWPERISQLLPDTCLNVDIVVNNDNSRTIEFQL